MPPKISKEKKDIILQIYNYFEAESKRGAPFHSWNKIAKRTEHCLKISESLIKNLVKSDGYDEKSNNNTKSKTITRKDTLDQFDKDLINTVVYNLFQKNECVTSNLVKNSVISPFVRLLCVR